MNKQSMNKQRWLACDQPADMLRFVSDKASDRKLRLFAVACCQLIGQSLIEEENCRIAVEVAEQFAEGLTTVRRCREVRTAVTLVPWNFDGGIPGRRAELVRGLLKPDASDAASVTSDRVLSWTVSTPDRAARSPERKRQVMLLREVFGNPFRPVIVDPSWRTPTVEALARGAYDERAFDRLPILADALEDAGCDGDELLSHLRDPNAAHVRGCWALDLVLGKE
jgi:hypothetical protein